MSQRQDVGDGDVGGWGDGRRVVSEQHRPEPPPRQDVAQHEAHAVIVAVAAVEKALQLCLGHGLRCAEPSLRKAMACGSNAFAANAALLAASHAHRMCPFRVRDVREAVGDAENKLRDLVVWRCRMMARDEGRASFLKALATVVDSHNGHIDQKVRARFLQTYQKITENVPGAFLSNNAKKKERRGFGRKKRVERADEWHVDL